MRSVRCWYAALLLFVGTACDQLYAEVLATAVYAKTPALADAAAIDPTLAEILPIDHTLFSDAVTLGVFVSQQNEEILSSQQFVALEGARVVFSPAPQQYLTLCDLASDGHSGVHAATNIAHDALVNASSSILQEVPIANTECFSQALPFNSTADYNLRIQTETEGYSIDFVAPPDMVASNVAFTPQLAPLADHYGATLRRHPLNTALSIDWSADNGGDWPVFLTVARAVFTASTSADASAALNMNNYRLEEGGPIVYDDLPRTTQGLLEAMTGGSRGTSASIGAEVFDLPGVYLVALVRVAVSTNVSENLRLGSGAAAANAALFAVWVD